MNAPLCLGKYELFDSTDREDHVQAAALCRQCPMLATCKAPPANEFPVGTWAGRLHMIKNRYPVAGIPLAGRTCERCEGTYDANAANARYCESCRLEVKRARGRHYPVYQSRKVARRRTAA